MFPLDKNNFSLLGKLKELKERADAEMKVACAGNCGGVEQDVEGD